MELMDLLGTQLFEDLHGAYRPTLDDILQLEHDYPQVAVNQAKLEVLGDQVMANTQANMLYSLQGLLPEEKRRTRREIRDALHILTSVPGARPAMVGLLMKSFSAALYMVEHLFFLNREIGRRFADVPRLDALVGFTEANALYPTARVEAIVQRAYMIWREQYVLQNPTQK